MISLACSEDYFRDMLIGIGSKNPTKVNALQNQLNIFFKTATLLSKDVDSGVSEQPLSLLETQQGAINRARNVLNELNTDLGIGLEGGVYFLNDHPYLCNWGALITQEGSIYTASGASIPLPKTFKNPLFNQVELSELIDDYTKKKNVRHKEGTIGIFTSGVISRQQMFEHVIALVIGQYIYTGNQKKIKSLETH